VADDQLNKWQLSICQGYEIERFGESIAQRSIEQQDAEKLLRGTLGRRRIAAANADQQSHGIQVINCAQTESSVVPTFGTNPISGGLGQYQMGRTPNDKSGVRSNTADQWSLQHCCKPITECLGYEIRLPPSRFVATAVVCSSVRSAFYVSPVH